MYPNGQADPDNQRPDKWSSTVFLKLMRHRDGKNNFLMINGRPYMKKEYIRK